MGRRWGRSPCPGWLRCGRSSPRKHWAGPWRGAPPRRSPADRSRASAAGCRPPGPDGCRAFPWAAPARPVAAGRPPQVLVVAVLAPRLADDVAGLEAPVLRPLQLARADLADQPEHVRRERPVRVLADVGALHADAGETFLVLEQVEEQPAIEALLEHDG